MLSWHGWIEGKDLYSTLLRLTSSQAIILCPHSYSHPLTALPSHLIFFCHSPFLSPSPLFLSLHLLPPFPFPTTPRHRRALTFQRVSSWRVDQDVVARVSSDSMFVRDVCVAQAPLRLGDLSGNFFAITLRKEEGSNTQNSLTILGQPSASSLLSSFAAVASYPFMNIFGVQRFGSPLPSNPEVGMRLLASDYRGMYVRAHVPFLVLVFRHIYCFSSFCTFSHCLKIKLHRAILSLE
jgi:hypothetical protein